MSSSLRDKLKAEVLATDARELVPHFARGALLLVAPTLDLLEVAEAIARDEKPRIEAWISAQHLHRASDDDGRSLVSQPTLRFQFVIVQPWVLAQRLP